MENHPLDGLRLVSYMDLGEDAVDADTVLPYATFSAVVPYKFEGNVAYKEARTVVWADREIGVKLHNLKRINPMLSVCHGVMMQIDADKL